MPKFFYRSQSFQVTQASLKGLSCRQTGHSVTEKASYTLDSATVALDSVRYAPCVPHSVQDKNDTVLWMTHGHLRYRFVRLVRSTVSRSGSVLRAE